MTTKIGEIQTEITGEVRKTEDLKAVFRLYRGEETTSKAEFKMSEDLKKGDKVKITIEKI
jgi:positive regulator of sigma E activity